MSKLSSAKLASSTSQILNNDSSLQIDITKCTYCLNGLGNVSIKCNECKNFYLCLKCFSMSAEIGEHKKDHNYYLKSPECFPIFDSENLWTYKEEILMLELIEQFGLGNWEDISKNLANRTPKDCEKHYYSYYVYGNLGKYTINSNFKNGTIEKQDEINDTIDLSIKTSEIQTTVLLPPIEMSIEEQRALGYMPLRDDFEREFKNDAESYISNLSVANNQIQYIFKENSYKTSSTDDDQIDFDLKLTLIKIYRECLIERQHHKKIAREYGLINNASALINTVNKTSNLTNSNGLGILSEIHAAIPPPPSVGRPKKHKLSQPNPNSNDKDINEINEKFKKYAQLLSVAEYESLIDILHKQRQLNERINELNNYRSLGITKINDIDNYNRQNLEKQKLKLELRYHKKHTKRMLSYTSPNKRLTRFHNIKSPVKSFSPSKRIKIEQADEETQDNDDMMTDDLNEDTYSDDLYQEKSDEDTETKDTEEDMSSAGAASSVGSGINEVNTNNIVRRLRRLNSRSSQNNSFSNRNGKKILNLSLKSAKITKNLRKSIRNKVSDDEVEEDENETLNGDEESEEPEDDDGDDDHDNDDDHDEDEIQLRSKKRKIVSSRSSSRSSSTASSNLSTSLSNSSSEMKNKAKKENLSIRKSAMTRRSTSERLCSMPGYNLLSENEKKNSLICRNNSHEQHDSIDFDDSLNENLDKKANNYNDVKSKHFSQSLKRSCPIYSQIPRSTRRRILRFLNDNGWIHVF